MTRAEEYRTEVIRAASARKRADGKGVGPSQERRPRPATDGVAAGGEPARPRRRRPGPGATPHNQAPTHTKNSSYELEARPMATGRPTRKSTRKALNRQKNDSSLRITQMNLTSSASVRAKALAPRKNGAG